MDPSRFSGWLLAAVFAALVSFPGCQPQTTFDTIGVGQPPAPLPPLTEIAVNVVASQVTGPITLNGGAFPANQYEWGELVMQGAHPEDLVVLGPSWDQGYETFVVNGPYDVEYDFRNGGGVVPQNELAALISDRVIDGGVALPIDVRAVEVSAVFSLNGSPFPASQYDRAKFFLQPEGSEALIFLGDSHLANDPVRVVPGSYHVIYEYQTGSLCPINKGARVQQSVAINSDSQLRVNVRASTLRVMVTLDGNPFPSSQYNDANFYLRDELTGSESWLMNSHDPVTSLMAIDGTYDVIYRHETGSQVPINTAAVVLDNFVLSAGGALLHDVKSVTIDAEVTLNGFPFEASEYQDGILALYDARTSTDTVLGNTHSPFQDLVLIPGTYDVLYSRETGNEVPQNTRGRVATAVAITNTDLKINVQGLQASVSLTLNGGAFPATEYDDAHLFLSGVQSDAAIDVGNTHDQVLSVMVLPGTYELLYRHESGADVPRNGNYPVLVDQVLTKDTLLSRDLQARYVRLAATLNDAPFPKSVFNTGRIFARSRAGDDVLLLRTHGVQDTPMLITGDYELSYAHTKGSTVPLNPQAKVGQVTIQ